MKVQIWADMEGTCGISKWEQVLAGNAAYEEGRLLYTQEINAAVRGAKNALADEIICVDGHGAGGPYTFNSWIKRDLEPGAQYLSGFRWGCYVEDMKNTDAILMTGAHAMQGTPNGVLCHTMSMEHWYNVYINGVRVGESGLVAAIAGSFNVPLVFVSGDQMVCQQTKDLVGEWVVTAQVKTGVGRFAARHLAPTDACDLIELQVESALLNKDDWPRPYILPSPVEIKVEFATPDNVEEYRDRGPGVKVIDERTVVSTAETAWKAWDQFWHH